MVVLLFGCASWRARIGQAREKVDQARAREAAATGGHRDAE
jgi:hypothetical protein